ncbi:MAG: hypothetical protein OZ921_18365 [Sorangiineae bacterium]|nr:hypothetical protein [Polyangiaceae bacterium]MEB2324485.1 hypothetical protein [Sorangiineae bacterium]
MKRLLALALLGALGSCAPTPRPRVLSEADAASRSPAAIQADELAPQAVAQARLLRARAERAFDDDDVAGSQIIGEQAIAAYGRAFVLARLARAERRLAAAEARRSDAERAVSALDEKVARVTAEADALELRAKVAEDALPLVPNQPATPERERARLEAARSLALEARLLCVSATLLGAHGAALDRALSDLGALDQTLAGSPKATPIDDAFRLRAACLAVLTHTRRPAARQAPSAGQSDALLSELSKLDGLQPYRDDRGVVVTLRGVLGPGEQPTATAKALLETLARVAAAHPDFPVLVVVHAAAGAASARDGKRAATIARALQDAGAPKVEAAAAGGAAPVLDPAQSGAAARNERVEIVFVAPAT